MTTNTNEEWRAIAGYPRYEVSNLGRVRSWAKWRCKEGEADEPRILKTVAHSNTAYLKVNLYGANGKCPRLVHQLVLEAFKGERPEGMVCRHINGDPTDNRADNLVWGTPKENTADRYLHGTANITSGAIPPVLTDDEVIDVYIRTQLGETVSSIAKDYPQAHRDTIGNVAAGKSRKKVIRDFLTDLHDRDK